MKLIAFPHYTCGGLLCDIFNNTFSNMYSNGAISNANHSIGKIGDSESIFDKYDPTQIENILTDFENTDKWIGTHCWPGLINLSTVDCILLITTTTYRSKIYRWARVYYHYFSQTVQWTELSGLNRIDKERETAKNYMRAFDPVAGENCICIEFSEIVDNTQGFKNLTSEYNTTPHIDRWRKNNSFLYDTNFWHSTPVQRYYEAELEVNTNTNYVYK